MAKAHRTFVSYIDKSREYYAAQGYDVPYKWAAATDAPFAPLVKPLSECRIGVITTSSLSPEQQREPFVAPSKPMPAAMETQHLYWHKEATHTNDLGSFLPLAHLRQLEDEGVIASVSPRFYGIGTVYSQRRTNTWAEDVRIWLEEDDVDLAVLIPL